MYDGLTLKKLKAQRSHGIRTRTLRLNEPAKIDEREKKLIRYLGGGGFHFATVVIKGVGTSRQDFHLPIKFFFWW